MGNFLSLPYKLLYRLEEELSYSARWLYLKLLCKVIFKYRTRVPKSGAVFSGAYSAEYKMSKPTYITALKELRVKGFIFCCNRGKWGEGRRPSKYKLLIF